MRRVLLVGVLTSAAGCRRARLTDDVDTPALASAVVGCEELPSPRSDWCAMSQLGSLPYQSFSGVQLLPLCKNMREPAAKDHCIARAMRIQPVPEPETCDLVEDDRLRQSCWLDVEDYRVTEATSLDDVVALCRRSGDLYQHCLVHFVGRSVDRWKAAGPIQFDQEIAYLVEKSGNVDEMDHFATSVAVAAIDVGVDWDNASFCAHFGGEALAACERVRRRHGTPEAGGP